MTMGQAMNIVYTIAHVWALPLEMILRACDEQRLLPRTLTVDDLFADCVSFLGDEAR